MSPLVNEIRSLDGSMWDTLVLTVDIPAGKDNLTVQLVSDGDDPASLNWIAAALSVPVTPVPALARITGGGWRVTSSGDVDIRSSQGLTLHCDIALSNNLQVNWGQGENWHINKLVDAAFCKNNLAFTPEPPDSGMIDTYIGLDVGMLNGDDGSVACFILEDHGETAGDPDGPDQALLRIWQVGFDPGITPGNLNDPGFDCLASQDPATDPNTALWVPLSDVNGNLQFHLDQPHKNK
ncbi:MAG: hypothetical protein O2909_09590 [Chloroflexi bacterium]|nr:hypothetical protein [Chloroflexota bacterium]